MTLKQFLGLIQPYASVVVMGWRTGRVLYKIEHNPDRLEDVKASHYGNMPISEIDADSGYILIKLDI